MNPFESEGSYRSLGDLYEFLRRRDGEKEASATETNFEKLIKQLRKKIESNVNDVLQQEKKESPLDWLKRFYVTIFRKHLELEATNARLSRLNALANETSTIISRSDVALPLELEDALATIDEVARSELLKAKRIVEWFKEDGKQHYDGGLWKALMRLHIEERQAVWKEIDPDSRMTIEELQSITPAIIFEKMVPKIEALIDKYWQAVAPVFQQ